MPIKSTPAKPKVLLPKGQSRSRRQRNSGSGNTENLDSTTTTANISLSNTSVIRNVNDVSVNASRLHQTLNTTTARPVAPQALKILRWLSPIIEQVQRPGVNMDESLLKIEKLYNEMDNKKDFPEVLWRVMIIPFHNLKGNEKTERIVKFFHRIVTSVGTDFKSLGNRTLCLRILKLCIKYHREKRIPVRFRIVETVVKILEFGAEDILSREIKEQLGEILMERIRDKHHSVRAQSAIALGLLRISSEYPRMMRTIPMVLITALTSDPNHEVRKAAVKSLPIERGTIEYLVHKVTDKNDTVKVAALSVISEKIPIRTFTIFQRECILQSSLNDTSGSVRSQGILVLKKWLESCQGNLCELLHKLDVIEKEKLCYLVLDTLFPEPNAESFDNIEKSFMEGKLVPLKNLTVERTFLWLFMVRKFSNHAYYKEKLMPAPNDMFAYIKSFLAIPITDDSDTKKEKLHFMLRHIMRILKFLQLEEGSRCQMKEVIGLIFQSDHLSGIHINVLVQLLHLCWLDEKEEGLMFVVNRVLDQSAKILSFSEPPQSMDEDEIMNLKLNLATIMHNRHKRKREQDDAVCQNDFVLAQACQVEIADLIHQELDLKAKLQSYTEAEKNKLEENSEDEEEAEYSAGALCTALSTIIAHVQITQSISPLVRHFYEHRVANEMHKFDDVRLRQKTLKLMTLVGFQNFEDAEKSMIFCIQGLLRDEHCVQVDALKCMFDLILQYSFDEFEALPKVVQVLIGTDENLDLSQRTLDEALSPLRLLTLSFLGSYESELLNTSVEGVIKLLLANKFHSPKVVKTLLLIWVNPVNSQTKIYKDVQRWLPIYANTGLTQGNLIANALVPCITQILSSRRNSPLSDASIESLAAFVLQSTDQKRLDHISNAHKIHEVIAMNVLEEMKDHICTSKSIEFARILKQLDLKNCDIRSLCEMLKLSKYLSRDPNRHVRTIMTDFIQYLKSLGGFLEDDSEAESDACPPPAGSQSERTENCDDDSINVNKVFSSSESDEEECGNSTIVTRSPNTTVTRLSQQSLRSLRSSRMPSSQPSVLSPIVSDDGAPSDGDSSDGVYGPTPPFK